MTFDLTVLPLRIMNEIPKPVDNYFKELTLRNERLSEECRKHIDALPELSMSIDEMAQEIASWCWSEFKKVDEDWDKIDEYPWWVGQTVDHGVPCSSVPHNGSLACTMGYSVESAELHVRAMLEYCRGNKEIQSLMDYPLVAKVELDDDGNIIPAKW